MFETGKHKGELINREECIKNIKNLCLQYEDILGKVILFGSVARGENTEYSDIDLYIEPKNKKITTSKMMMNKRFDNMEQCLFDMYPENEYDILVFGGTRDIKSVRQTLLWKQIQKDGVILYDNREDEVE